MSDVIQFRYRAHLTAAHWRVVTTLPTASILEMIQGLVLKTSGSDVRKAVERVQKLFYIQGEMLAIIKAMYYLPCERDMDGLEVFAVSIGQTCLYERINQTTIKNRNHAEKADGLCNRIDNMMDAVQAFLGANERFFSPEHAASFDRILNYFELMNEALHACLGRTETVPLGTPERREVLGLYPNSTQVTPERPTERIRDAAQSINQAVERTSPTISRRALKFI